MREFNDIIESRVQLRSILKEPSELVTRKTLKYLDKHCGVVISRSAFMLLATADVSGNTDVSPKGDPMGFVKILDNQTLAPPDAAAPRRLAKYYGCRWRAMRVKIILHR